jgi:peptide deformylase
MAVRKAFRQDDAKDRLVEQLRVLGDPVLRQPTNTITVFDARLEKLAKNMLEIMQREDGVGLAANQVGVLSRMMVWRHPESEDECYVYVNPQIVEKSEACCTESEGCLSVPGATMPVERAEEVIVEAQDLHGGQFRVHLTGMLARIVQHEIDHLDGHLILDRTTPEERRRVLKELRERSLSSGT